MPDDELVPRLAAAFEPLPVVSPWNKGSGFAGNGKSREAEKALADVRESTDSRLAALREGVLRADEVIARGKQLGWGGSGDELWDAGHKEDVVQLCRNMLPDAALAWIDTAIVLGQDADGRIDLSYNRLLGTGGNFGRQDLQATYVQRVLTLLGDGSKHKSSLNWLRAALLRDESVPYLRDSVGQFDPGRAGGIQSSPLEKRDEKGFANPWAFLLTIEGAMLFASAATKRAGAANSGASLPFLVRASGVGFGSAADGENAMAEIWTPEWSRYASLAEIEQLLGEGRAQWRGQPARSGLDFARAVATLGVDRGISRFTRSVFVERHGQSPLAVPVGVIDVRERRGVSLLRDVDTWLGALRRGEQSSLVQAGVRAVDRAMYALATSPGSSSALDVLVALGALHQVVGRSAKARVSVNPLMLGATSAWVDELSRAGEFDRAETRLAYVLATSGSPRMKRDEPGRWADIPLRHLLTPVAVGAAPAGSRDKLRWADRPPRVDVGRGMVPALACAHERRAFPGLIEEPAPPEGAGWPMPGVRGIFSAFRWGPNAELADLCSFVAGETDDELFGSLLPGFLLLDRRDVPPLPDLRPRDPAKPADGDDVTFLIPPVLALLLPFYSDIPLRIRFTEEPSADMVTLRPGTEWIRQLIAGHVDIVVVDAVRRLRVAGVGNLPKPSQITYAGDGSRLAVALLAKLHPRDRIKALHRVAGDTESQRTLDKKEPSNEQ